LLKILFGEMRERKVVVGCFGKGERRDVTGLCWQWHREEDELPSS
jgi:hypothetical protein